MNILMSKKTNQKRPRTHIRVHNFNFLCPKDIYLCFCAESHYLGYLTDLGWQICVKIMEGTWEGNFTLHLNYYVTANLSQNNLCLYILDVNEIIIGENSDYETSDSESETEDSECSQEMNADESFEINDFDDDSEENQTENGESNSLEGATTKLMNWSKNSIYIPNAPNFTPSDQKIKDSALKNIMENDPTPLSVFKYFVNEATVQNILDKSVWFSEDIKRNDPTTLTLSLGNLCFEKMHCYGYPCEYTR